MMQGFSKQWRIVPPLALAMLMLACSEDGTEPADDVNPVLAEEVNSSGIAPSSDGGLPQGSAPFTGPGGIRMDGAAKEFYQRATFDDGTVWRTSGFSIHGVPQQAAVAGPIDRVSFGAAITGSLAGVQPGRYEISAEWPQIDFIREVFVAHASVKETGASLRDPRPRGDEGFVTITEVSYFDDVYPCQGKTWPANWTVERCDYQLGIVRGAIEFEVTLTDGTVVEQEPTSFALPIQRETIYVQFHFAHD